MYIVLFKLSEKKPPTKNQSTLSYLYPAVSTEHVAWTWQLRKLEREYCLMSPY